MGLLGKLKSMKDAVTGGSAKVILEMGGVMRGQQAGIRIRAIPSADIKPSSIYLQVRARETAELLDTDWEDGHSSRERVRGRRTSYENKFPIAAAQELESGQEYTWEGQFALPDNVNPSLRGQMIQHIWEARAGLDTFGNDPDSGWQEFEVR